jgi:hypothetical protein
MPDDPEPAPLTVSALVARLSAYPGDRLVVFIHPDTKWRADVSVREPEPKELLDGEDASPPLIVTGIR